MPEVDTFCPLSNYHIFANDSLERDLISEGLFYHLNKATKNNYYVTSHLSLGKKECEMCKQASDEKIDWTNYYCMKTRSHYFDSDSRELKHSSKNEFFKNKKNVRLPFYVKKERMVSGKLYEIPFEIGTNYIIVDPLLQWMKLKSDIDVIEILKFYHYQQTRKKQFFIIFEHVNYDFYKNNIDELIRFLSLNPDRLNRPQLIVFWEPNSRPLLYDYNFLILKIKWPNRELRLFRKSSDLVSGLPEELTIPIINQQSLSWALAVSSINSRWHDLIERSYKHRRELHLSELCQVLWTHFNLKEYFDEENECKEPPRKKTRVYNPDRIPSLILTENLDERVYPVKVHSTEKLEEIKKVIKDFISKFERVEQFYFFYENPEDTKLLEIQAKYTFFDIIIESLVESLLAKKFLEYSQPSPLGR